MPPPFRSPATRPSSARASAPITAVSTQYFTSTIPPHGAGGSALTTVPGGVITVSGRNAPELTSAPGSRKALMIVKAPVGAIAGPTFVGAGAWGEVPVRSTQIVSPATVTRARMVSGSSRVRPLSRCDSYAYSPSGRAAMARRMRCSARSISSATAARTTGAP